MCLERGQGGRQEQEVVGSRQKERTIDVLFATLADRRLPTAYGLLFPSVVEREVFSERRS